MTYVQDSCCFYHGISFLLCLPILSGSIPHFIRTQRPHGEDRSRQRHPKTPVVSARPPRSAKQIRCRTPSGCLPTNGNAAECEQYIKVIIRADRNLDNASGLDLTRTKPHPL